MFAEWLFFCELSVIATAELLWVVLLVFALSGASKGPCVLLARTGRLSVDGSGWLSQVLRLAVRLGFTKSSAFLLGPPRVAGPGVLSAVCPQILTEVTLTALCAHTHTHTPGDNAPSDVRFSLLMT